MTFILPAGHFSHYTTPVYLAIFSHLIFPLFPCLCACSLQTLLVDFISQYLPLIPVCVNAMCTQICTNKSAFAIKMISRLLVSTMCCRICDENEGEPSAFGDCPRWLQSIHHEISCKRVHFWLPNWSCVPPRLQGTTKESPTSDTTPRCCLRVSSERSSTW